MSAPQVKGGGGIGALWTDRRTRTIAFQIITLFAVVAFFAYVAHNTVVNLERQNVASGFDFLGSTAGFGIIMHLVPYSEQSTYAQAFFVGLINTIIVAIIGIFFATILGFIIGIARLSPNWLISTLANAYIEIVRNIPLLLQIFVWYFGVLRSMPSPRDSHAVMDLVFLNIRGLYLPRPVPEDGASIFAGAVLVSVGAIVVLKRWADKRQMETGRRFPVLRASIGILIALPGIAAIASGIPFSFEYPEFRGFNFRGGMVLIPEFVALVLALATYTAAFIGEIVRSGIQAVDYGQTEASHALGLRDGQTLRLIVIPQAMRVIIPPLTSQYLNLTKNSSLAAAIAYPDLVSVFAGTVLNQTGQAVEVLAMVMAVYLSLSIGTSLFMNWYNARRALVER